MFDEGPTSINGIKPRLENTEMPPALLSSCSNPRLAAGLDVWPAKVMLGVTNCGFSNIAFIAMVSFPANCMAEVPLFQRSRSVK